MASESIAEFKVHAVGLIAEAMPCPSDFPWWSAQAAPNRGERARQVFSSGSRFADFCFSFSTVGEGTQVR
jgi:hypothetical protein